MSLFVSVLSVSVHEQGCCLLSSHPSKEQSLWGRQQIAGEDDRDTTPPYLRVSGSGGSITFSVIHDSTIRANYTLHCSHLVAWPARGSALGSKREEKRGSGVSKSEPKRKLKKTRKTSKKQMVHLSHQSNPHTQINKKKTDSAQTVFVLQKKVYNTC